MNWVFLIMAGLFEMLGVLMINKWNKERNVLSILLLVAGFGLSFWLLSLAMKTLPMGTAYAVWTGIGASGGAILGMIFYGESRNALRILFIAMVLGSAVGLKLVS
ncbi:MULTISPECIES: DMT family transporter [Paenibacillus]|uniref:DMT family transporter n=1 Tax=Paenibacillus TaxID=44249 RepID=UPI00129D86FD|nr:MULTISPECIES: multidrug efflux SMR transporter [Paenibacillus]MBE7683985.1 QacE family quaternary ammonium compound efflux SMR transporter [Paenibacillus sp. P13VS]MBY0219118.1 multidrug efflux SMR transporter [Paenibacillus illinoisensis]MCM3203022.1 multidrug efflux SMR transporter [Paenibacillus illinoisensis]WJH29644.1 multidrug efflux SMR transporter [Paenibacillus sp. CC-CFT742]